MLRTVAIGSLLFGSLGASLAHADDARDLAASASFTPGILRATDAGAGFVTASSEFSGAGSSSVRIAALGEVNLYGPLRVAARVYDAFGTKPKPGVGVGVRWLDGAVKSTAYLFYKTEGFTEPEGEIEAVVAFEHAFGAVHGNANFAYGQDPEGRERDGELALVGQVEPIDGLFVGGTARYRDALGSRKEPVIRDGFAGATSTVAVGRFALTGMAGIAMVQTQTAPRAYGPGAALALGAMF